MSAIPTKARSALSIRDTACVRCAAPATDVHHRVRRREGGHALSNMVRLCRRCHRYVHANPRAARALGYIVPATWVGLDTEVVPVFSRTRGWVQLKDDGAAVSLREAEAVELLFVFGMRTVA